MTSDVVIRAENLGKKYLLTHQNRGRSRYTALRDVIADGVKGLWARVFSARQRAGIVKEEFWALREVSFEVLRGEAIGIIGRNGAGKSTLLKVLSRITEPTTGRLSIKGRVASLLEVGTGFHPELTGRENIFLNGAILGMTNGEIKRRFDEIVDFAEVEKFLDTPVKHFSSGMYMRLAFAVAAHLEPEILVIDEVLAVGDAAFQKKCLGKMGDVAKQGRTVLFVSHNMAAVTQLCRNAIHLQNGRVVDGGPAASVVNRYLASDQSVAATVDLTDFPTRTGSGIVRFEWGEMRGSEGEARRDFCIGEDVIVAFRFQAKPGFHEKQVRLAIQLRTSDGTNLCNMADMDSDFAIKDFSGAETISVRLPDIRLYPDTYYLSLWVGSITNIDVYDWVRDCLSFAIVGGGQLTTRTLPRHAGLLFWTPTWTRHTTASAAAATKSFPTPTR
jgi:lipopolysaccharide transport system ATP-binding protein